jgi:hypothetical protein
MIIKCFIDKQEYSFMSFDGNYLERLRLEAVDRRWNDRKITSVYNVWYKVIRGEAVPWNEEK